MVMMKNQLDHLDLVKGSWASETKLFEIPAKNHIPGLSFLHL